MLEPRLAEVLEAHGLQDSAMVMYHCGIRTCMDLVRIRHGEPSDWSVFLARVQMQYHILGRTGADLLPRRVVEAAVEEAAKQGPVSASDRLRPAGRVLIEPTGKSSM